MILAKWSGLQFTRRPLVGAIGRVGAAAGPSYRCAMHVTAGNIGMNKLKQLTAENARIPCAASASSGRNVPAHVFPTLMRERYCRARRAFLLLLTASALHAGVGRSVLSCAALAAEPLRLSIAIKNRKVDE